MIFHRHSSRLLCSSEGLCGGRKHSFWISQRERFRQDCWTSTTQPSLNLAECAHLSSGATVSAKRRMYPYRLPPTCATCEVSSSLGTTRGPMWARKPASNYSKTNIVERVCTKIGLSHRTLMRVLWEIGTISPDLLKTASSGWKDNRFIR